MIEVHNQTELDDALENHPLEQIVCRDGYFVISGSSHVEARGSSHVEAWGSSHVVARESSHVVASKFSSISIQSDKSICTGGIQIKIPSIFTPQVWCDYNGVEATDGVVVLYKALDDNYKSGYGAKYKPDTIPIAPDWDGGVKECGGGYHFCSSPRIAKKRFHEKATKFMACPVALADCATITNPQYRDTIKARGCCAPIWEVDIDGNKIAGGGK